MPYRENNAQFERTAKTALTIPVDKAPVIFVYGPTGVGKTDFVDTLSQKFCIEIINMDMGQQYVPLSVGTAKPDWKNSLTIHHLFDVFDTPTFGTVCSYRAAACAKIKEIKGRNRIPVFVGGSGFYLKSLLFPPRVAVDDDMAEVNLDNYYPLDDNRDWWTLLMAIDQERAQQIHPRDIYRIKRALAIWHKTGVKPSVFRPIYSPPAPYSLVFLTRETDDLYGRIDQRVVQMMESGWLDETRLLMGTVWQDFIRSKKIIGYQELFSYLAGFITKETAIMQIQQATRNYAKRQKTFWRMMLREINNAAKNYDTSPMITTINLTKVSSDLYINHLLKSTAL